jgi:hypothetical protein
MFSSQAQGQGCDNKQQNAIFVDEEVVTIWTIPNQC